MPATTVLEINNGLKIAQVEKMSWLGGYNVPSHLRQSSLYGTPHAAPGTAVYDWVVNNRNGPNQSAFVIGEHAFVITTAMVLDLLRQYGSDTSRLGQHPLRFTDSYEIAQDLRDGVDVLLKPRVLVSELPPDNKMEWQYDSFRIMKMRRERSRGRVMLIPISPDRYESLSADGLLRDFSGFLHIDVA